MTINNDWYPHRGSFKSFEEYDAHVQTLKQLYSLRDKVNSHPVTPKAEPKAQDPAYATGLNGIQVKAVPPLDGQVLKYNAKTGQIEWTT